MGLSELADLNRVACPFFYFFFYDEFYFFSKTIDFSRIIAYNVIDSYVEERALRAFHPASCLTADAVFYLFF